MINWNLNLFLTTSKAAVSVMQRCVQEAGTCGSEAACAHGPGLGEDEGGNLKGSGGVAGTAEYLLGKNKSAHLPLFRIKVNPK